MPAGCSRPLHIRLFLSRLGARPRALSSWRYTRALVCFGYLGRGRQVYLWFRRFMVWSPSFLVPWCFIVCFFLRLNRVHNLLMLSPRFNSTSGHAGARASARRRKRFLLRLVPCLARSNIRHAWLGSQLGHLLISWASSVLTGFRCLVLRMARAIARAGLPPTPLDAAAVLHPASTHSVGLGLRYICTVTTPRGVPRWPWLHSTIYFGGAGLLVAQTLVLRVAVGALRLSWYDLRCRIGRSSSSGVLLIMGSRTRVR